MRSFTPSMATLIEQLGATPVSMPFSEVYPSLQRGVANCGVTSPTSGNTGKWPEVTTHFLPLSVSGSVQGHFMNLDYWKRFTPAQQQKIHDARLQADGRPDVGARRARSTTTRPTATSAREPCKEDTKFKMTLVDVAPPDRAEDQDRGQHRRAAAVEEHLQQGRSELQRGLERHGRQGPRLQDRLAQPMPSSAPMYDERSPRVARSGRHRRSRWMQIACGWWLIALSRRHLRRDGGAQAVRASACRASTSSAPTPLAIVSAFGFSYALLTRGHTRVDFLLVAHAARACARCSTLRRW